MRKSAIACHFETQLHLLAQETCILGSWVSQWSSRSDSLNSACGAYLDIAARGLLSTRALGPRVSKCRGGALADFSAFGPYSMGLRWRRRTPAAGPRLLGFSIPSLLHLSERTCILAHGCAIWCEVCVFGTSYVVGGGMAFSSCRDFG